MSNGLNEEKNRKIVGKDINGKEATGGRVWFPDPNSNGPSLLDRFVTGSANFVLNHPILLCVLFLGWIPVVAVIGYWSSPPSSSDAMSSAWEQEYGYQEVSVNNDFSEAEVVTATGEIMSVDALKYKGARILFESQEQLYEKIEEVESGTYPEELYQP